MQSAVDPVSDDHAFGLIRLGFIFGRHFTTFEHFEYVLPTLQFASRRQISVECVQRDLALTFVRPMTLYAIRLEKRSDVLFKGSVCVYFANTEEN